jgi:type VI secretion system secreted protein VgrG
LTPGSAPSDTSARAGVNIHQFYRLELKGAPAAALADIYAFEGARGIGEPTKYTIQFTHPRHDLSRSEFLNRIGTFVIQPPCDRWSQPERARHVQGVVTAFALKATYRDESRYEIVLESRLALLRNVPKCRFFLDMTIPEIIEKILREHAFNKIFAGFEFQLYRTYRKRGFVMQWGEDDLTFITRLCRRSGIWFVCEEGERCEWVRFGDDYAHYRRDPARLTAAYRSYSGLETTGQESVSQLEMRAKTLPTTYAVRTFSTEAAVSEPIEATSPIREDRTTYGEAYTWGTPDLTEDEAREEAQLRREAALAEQVEYHGVCDMLDLAAGCVLKLSNRALPDARHGLLVVRMTCGASRRQAYRVTFDAIPSDRQYRLPLKEETWPKVHGVITGTIASSSGWRNPYLDQQGEYIVHLHADRDPRSPGLQSCPMRLAKPFAGPGRTGFHFGLVEGTVVGVSFLWGCVDLPFISHVLHTAQHTDPIVAGVPWSTRNTIRTRSNNTVELDDREGKEHIKVATEHGKTQLNLGHTVDSNGTTRGEGFELRTDRKGHLRAGGGMLVSTDAQRIARGHQTDMAPAMDQFARTQAQAKELADVTRAAQVEVADLKAENIWLKNELAGLKQAVIALSAPNGIGMATPDRVLVSAGKDVSVTTSAKFNVNAVRHVAIAAGEVLSLFAHRLGIKLFAARGTVQIQAQSDAIRIASEQDTTITSSKGRVVIEAKKELLFKCGGSYFRMTANGIEDATRGDRKWRAAAYERSGPASLPADLPVLPVPAEMECARRASRAGVPFARI